jgi:hypothetical protein
VFSLLIIKELFFSEAKVKSFQAPKISEVAVINIRSAAEKKVKQER